MSLNDSVAILALSWMLVSPTSGEHLPTKRTPVHATICDLRSRPDVFRNATVSLDALLTSDGRHLILAGDSACQSAGIAVEFSECSSHDPGVVAVMSAIFAGRPGTAGKKITAHLVGKYYPRKRPRPLLAVVTVDNVHVSLITH
jgi:hypothetical protein